MKFTKNSVIILAVVTCLVAALVLGSNLNLEINVSGDGVGSLFSIFGGSSGNAQYIAPLNESTTSAPVVQNPVIQPPANDQTPERQENSTGIPSSTEEIIKKYTEVVDKFKLEKPAYKKKEFQALPEEYRNFGSAVNVVLNLASGYMTTEEDCEELVRPKGSAEEILYDMPIHGAEKACVLTDYNAVEWAKCEDMGNGTYKITFSLKKEVNAEPTPPDTLIPVSAHGAVMQPVKRTEITTEVDKITKSVPGLSLNQFDLTYNECVFECVYNPQTNQAASITHHVVIDIAADIKFITNINGTARLLNEMYIYDITW